MTSFVVVVFLRVIARSLAAVVAALDQNQASTILHVQATVRLKHSDTPRFIVLL